MLGLVTLGYFGKLRGSNKDIGVEYKCRNRYYTNHYVKVHQILELVPLEARWLYGHVMMSMITAHLTQLLL